MKTKTTRKDVAAILNQAHKFGTDGNAKRVASCQAWYYPILIGQRRFMVLRSYATNVALLSLRTDNLYVLDYYSATTCQHVNKFAKLMQARRIVRLYDNSRHVVETNLETCDEWRLTAEQARNMKKLDYACVIESIDGGECE